MDGEVIKDTMFSWTYLCKSDFFDMKFAKNIYRARLTDVQLQNTISVALQVTSLSTELYLTINGMSKGFTVQGQVPHVKVSNVAEIVTFFCQTGQIQTKFSIFFCNIVSKFPWLQREGFFCVNRYFSYVATALTPSCRKLQGKFFADLFYVFKDTSLWIVCNIWLSVTEV